MHIRWSLSQPNVGFHSKDCHLVQKWTDSRIPTLLSHWLGAHSENHGLILNTEGEASVRGSQLTALLTEWKVPSQRACTSKAATRASMWPLQVVSLSFLPAQWSQTWWLASPECHFCYFLLVKASQWASPDLMGGDYTRMKIPGHSVHWESTK